MKRAVVALAISLVGGAVTAAPARADDTEWPISCFADSEWMAQTVYFDEEGNLIVNPEAAPDDVARFADGAPKWLLDAFPCIVSPLPPLPPLPLRPVNCTLAAALQADPTRYVYPNPNGGYVIGIPAIQGDVRGILDCSQAT